MRIWAEGAAAGGQREGRKMLQRQDLKAMDNETQGRIKVDWYLVEMPKRTH